MDPDLPGNHHHDHHPIFHIHAYHPDPSYSVPIPPSPHLAIWQTSLSPHPVRPQVQSCVYPILQ